MKYETNRAISIGEEFDTFGMVQKQFIRTRNLITVGKSPPILSRLKETTVAKCATKAGGAIL